MRHWNILDSEESGNNKKDEAPTEPHTVEDTVKAEEPAVTDDTEKSAKSNDEKSTETKSADENEPNKDKMEEKSSAVETTDDANCDNIPDKDESVPDVQLNEGNWNCVIMKAGDMYLLVPKV